MFLALYTCAFPDFFLYNAFKKTSLSLSFLALKSSVGIQLLLSYLLALPGHV